MDIMIAIYKLNTTVVDTTIHIVCCVVLGSDSCTIK